MLWGKVNRIIPFCAQWRQIFGHIESSHDVRKPHTLLQDSLIHLAAQTIGSFSRNVISHTDSWFYSKETNSEILPRRWCCRDVKLTLCTQLPLGRIPPPCQQLINRRSSSLETLERIKRLLCRCPRRSIASMDLMQAPFRLTFRIKLDPATTIALLVFRVVIKTRG